MILILLMLASPAIILAETVAIIILAVNNSDYKKRITRLTGQLQEQGRPERDALPAVSLPIKAETGRVPADEPEQEIILPEIPVALTDAVETAVFPVTGQAVLPAETKSKTKSSGFFQGTAALIIGMVFIVLAGLIFATTAWHNLPSGSKVVMIFGFSGLFFGAGRLAAKLFHLKKTSQAFHLLGSIFLFLTVLAAGYFGVFGEQFTLAAGQRWKVLFAGSLVTELALLTGIKQFKDRIYTWACFWGLSVTVLFLMKALDLRTVDSIKGMACYSALLVLAAKLPKAQKENFASFAAIHFWIFGGIAGAIAVIEWLEVILAGLILGNAAGSLFTALMLALAAAAAAVMDLKREKQSLSGLHYLWLAAFFHYLGLCIKTDLLFQIFSGAIMTGLWFGLAKRRNSPLSGRAGDGLFTAALAADGLMIVVLALVNGNSVSEYLAAFLTVVLLTVLAAWWSKRYAAIRPLLPLILYPLTLIVSQMLSHNPAFSVRYSMVVFVFLLAVIAWDMMKSGFCVSILLIGTAAQFWFWLAGERFVLFAPLLSVYLLIKARIAPEPAKEKDEKWGCLYLLASVFFVLDGIAESMLFQLLCMTAVFIIEAMIFNRQKETGKAQGFWAITGMLLLLADLTVFYLDACASPEYLLLCLMVFAAFYLQFYRSGSNWLTLAAAVAVLPMPWIAAARYGMLRDHAYAILAAVLLLSGLVARRFVPIIAAGEDGKKKAAYDWFHILAVLDLLPVAVSARDGWRSVYLVLLVLYVLQYTGVAQMRKGALTAAAALGAVTFWTQPFIHYPELVRMEIQMIPAVLFTWIMPLVWPDKKIISKLQTVFYCLMLVVLIGDALHSGHVVDALILEMVCLVVFLWANEKKNVFWFRVSGAVIAGVALYMTKGFWLSLSWWIYLLAAGIGLIIFAAVNESKKQ